VHIRDISRKLFFALKNTTFLIFFGLAARYRAPEVLLQSSTYTPAIGTPFLSPRPF